MLHYKSTNLCPYQCYHIYACIYSSFCEFLSVQYMVTERDQDPLNLTEAYTTLIDCCRLVLHCPCFISSNRCPKKKYHPFILHCQVKSTLWFTFCSLSTVKLLSYLWEKVSLQIMVAKAYCTETCRFVMHTDAGFYCCLPWTSYTVTLNF